MTDPVTWGGTAEEALERIRGKLFVRTSEAAAILDIDPRTLRAAIDAGTIPAVRAGSTYRVPAAWIRAQLARGDGTPGAA